MVELTLDDVLRWMPERFNVSSDLLAGDNGHFDLEISWAVTIRAMDAGATPRFAATSLLSRQRRFCRS